MLVGTGVRAWFDSRHSGSVLFWRSVKYCEMGAMFCGILGGDRLSSCKVLHVAHRKQAGRIVRGGPEQLLPLGST
jgi:hypothetical protein